MRRKLIARSVAPLVVAAMIAAGGCSSSTPLSGSSGTPGSSAVTSPSPGASSASGATASAGLSVSCSSAAAAQVAISGLFDRPLNGHGLTAADVSAVFDRLGAGMPGALAGDVRVLHAAGTRMVGRSAVVVTGILDERPVAGALSALSAFVRNCAPPTS